MRMARSPLTLAALASTAIPALDVARAGLLGTPPAEDDPAAVDQALLETREGDRYVVRVARGVAAHTRLMADLTALHALSAGVRSRLPFALPSLAGQTRAGRTRAIVYDHLPGVPLSLSDVVPGTALVESVGRALAAVHALPTSFVADAGLPSDRAVDSRSAVLSVMDRAAATGLVPTGLLDRWERASEDPALWQFAPTVVNGGVVAGSILHDGDSVTGILNWQGLSVGDPAKDLVWALGASDPDASQALLEAYNRARGSSDRLVTKRARLYTEVEVAKWLLHGTEERSPEIVDDAVRMLHNLADLVQHDDTRTIATDTSPVMTVDEVEEMLDRAERTT
jgi:macrolide phosphotransferase